MRITFLLPEIAMGGGTKIALEYMQYLHGQGHVVTCVYPPKKLPSLREIWRAFRSGKWRVPEDKLQTGAFGRTDFPILIGDTRGRITARDVPDADFVIATWWETAEWMQSFPATKGAPCYLIQDHEVFPGLPIGRVRATYRADFHRITVSRWLQETLRDEYGVQSTLVPNGTDLKLFHPDDARLPDKFRVGLLWSDAVRKNSMLAIDAMLLARAEMPELVATLFGSAPRPAALAGLDWIDYVHLPSQRKIPDIYRRCRYWLFPSTSEGFGLPILEAMACGIPVIATSAGAAPDLVSAQNGFPIAADDTAMSCALIVALQKDDDEWQAMSKAARKSAEPFDACRSAEAFERCLIEIAARLR